MAEKPGGVTRAGRRRERLHRIADLLACPACGGSLSLTDEACTCDACGAAYPVRDHRIYFVDPAGSGDDIDDLKAWLRNRIGPYYRTIADIVAPDFPVLRTREIKRLFDPSRDVVVDFGSGSQRLGPQIVSVDFTDYEAVDIVCDICGRLPFVDGALDGSTSWGVMEHLPDPKGFARELHRCTKPGGRTLHMVPFLYHFHSSPHDYVRFTHKGLDILLEPFRVLNVHNGSGPVSYFLLGLVEFLSSLLSFGHDRIKAVLYLVICAGTFPLKLLDLPFLNRKAFLGIAPTLVVVAEKDRSERGPETG